MRATVGLSLLLCIALVAPTTTAQGPLPTRVPAFPGVEGAGRFTTGGRGGAVVRVTNLNPRGPGSLAAAVDGPNRIVVFDVSGVIDLTDVNKKTPQGGKLTIAHPNITIAGQTAPGDGICLTGGSLDISASNVIVRHLRSRRGWISLGDSGDAIEVKPVSIGEARAPSGLSQAEFDKTRAKKAERGKFIHDFAPLADVVIDHCSTSWATDENLTVTHADRSTVSWSIAAEGCDYANPKQTPPNHSEGSLWGSAAADGRSTMHHMLYAHNRLRNPRTTGGADVPAVLNFYNNVVYNWSEFASHTGSERVLVNWLGSYYRPGPDTREEIRTRMFEFHGDPACRIFARGNVVEGFDAAAADNGLAVGHNQKFKKASAEERAAMIVAEPFADAPQVVHAAVEARDAVFADVGATLPGRDPIDLRIVESARDGTGRIIEKETDLPAAARRLDYRSLKPAADDDGDGLPNFWEAQFGLDRADAADSARLHGEYAAIEHYFNNTDPTGENRAIVYVAATVSRGDSGRPAEWLIFRTGDLTKPLMVQLVRSRLPDGGSLVPAETFLAEIAAGKAYVRSTMPRAAAPGTYVLSPQADEVFRFAVGCPYQALVVVK